MLLLPTPPARRAWTDSVDGRPATWCALDVAASVARVTPRSRRPRRSLAAYPMNADASKAREAVSAVRCRHRRSAADVLASRRESVSLLTHSRALFDSVMLQCASRSNSDDLGGRGRPLDQTPPQQSLPPHRSRRRHVVLPTSTAERENSGRGRWMPDAAGVVCEDGNGGAPLAKNRTPILAEVAVATVKDEQTGGSSIVSRTRADRRRGCKAVERPDAENEARSVRFRLAAQGELRTENGGGIATAIDYEVATRSSGFVAAMFAGTPSDSAAFTALRDRVEPATMPDGLSLTPREPDRRAAARVPVTRMYRDRPSLTREQARKLQLIARLEDRELDALKTAPAAARQQPQPQPQPQQQPLSDDDSELSSDRSQAGSRIEIIKEKHWVDDVTVSSGSDHCTNDGCAAQLVAATAQGADNEPTAYLLPPCICPSSEQKSRLYCVKKWLVKTNFDACSKAKPLL